MNKYKYFDGNRYLYIEADGYSIDSWNDGRLYFWTADDKGQRENIAIVDQGRWHEVRKIASASEIDPDIISDFAIEIDRAIDQITEANNGSYTLSALAESLLSQGYRKR